MTAICPFSLFIKWLNYCKITTSRRLVVTCMLPNDVDYARIGQRVRQKRIEKGLSQADLSSMIDCSNNYLSHIETAQCKVSLGMLLRLSYALGESLDFFVLDTAFAKPTAIINETIASKLEKCNPTTLLTVAKMIDLLVEQQERLSDK